MLPAWDVGSGLKMSGDTWLDDLLLKGEESYQEKLKWIPLSSSFIRSRIGELVAITLDQPSCLLT